jgi:hypothetical protein
LCHDRRTRTGSRPSLRYIRGCWLRGQTFEEFNAERDAAQRLPVRLANAAAEDAGFDPRGLALRLGSRVATMMLMLLQDNEGITVAGAPGRSHPRMPPGALGGAGLSGPGSSRRNTHPTIGDSLRRDAIAQHGQHGKGRNLTTQTSPKWLSQPLPDMSVFPLPSRRAQPETRRPPRGQRADAERVGGPWLSGGAGAGARHTAHAAIQASPERPGRAFNQ